MRIFFLLLGLAVAAATAAGYLGAIREPVVVRYQVPLAGLAAPLRIVQLSDTHVNWLTMPPSRIAAIVAQANGLRPDMVVLTGDFHASHIVNWPEMRLEKALYPFRDLRAPLGVFAVLGNHDNPYWTKRVFARTPVRLLVADWVDAGPVILAGAESRAIPPDPAGNLRRAVDRAPIGKPLIVLTHEPEFFAALPPRAALMIAGHTHGGQIMLPFIGTRPIGPFIDRHLRGVFREHGQTLVVSSGLGTSVLPLRLGVPPEIIVITLVPAPSD